MPKPSNLKRKRIVAKKTVKRKKPSLPKKVRKSSPKKYQPKKVKKPVKLQPVKLQPVKLQPVKLQPVKLQPDNLEDTIHIVILAHGSDIRLDKELIEKYKTDVRMVYIASNDTVSFSSIGNLLCNDINEMYKKGVASVNAVNTFVTSCKAYNKGIIKYIKNDKRDFVKNAINAIKKDLLCNSASLVVDRKYTFDDHNKAWLTNMRRSDHHDGGIFVMRCRKDGVYVPIKYDFESNNLLLFNVSSGNNLLDTLKFSMRNLLDFDLSTKLSSILEILHKQFNKIVIYDLGCRNRELMINESPNKISKKEADGNQFLKNLTMAAPKRLPK